MRAKGIALGILVILVSNAAALIGVALNRTGEPFQTVELTERELPVQRTLDQDNSGISLRLNWMRYRFNQPGNSAPAAAPFNHQKLAELGFSTARRFILPKQLFVALELTPAGDLIAVDAAKNAEQLRQKYADSRKYIVVPGLVRPVLERTGEWRGFVAQILPPEIHVPLPFASILSRRDARYSVTLCYGRRLEPWIASINLR